MGSVLAPLCFSSPFKASGPSVSPHPGEWPGMRGHPLLSRHPLFPSRGCTLTSKQAWPASFPRSFTFRPRGAGYRTLPGFARVSTHDLALRKHCSFGHVCVTAPLGNLPRPGGLDNCLNWQLLNSPQWEALTSCCLC